MGPSSGNGVNELEKIIEGDFRLNRKQKSEFLKAFGRSIDAVKIRARNDYIPIEQYEIQILEKGMSKDKTGAFSLNDIVNFASALGTLVCVLRFSPLSILRYPDNYLAGICALKDKQPYQKYAIDKITKWSKDIKDMKLLKAFPQELANNYMYFMDRVNE